MYFPQRRRPVSRSTVTNEISAAGAARESRRATLGVDGSKAPAFLFDWQPGDTCATDAAPLTVDGLTDGLMDGLTDGLTTHTPCELARHLILK